MPKNQNKHVEPKLPASFSAIEPELNKLINDTIARAIAAKVEADPLLGDLSVFYSFGRSAQTLEGGVIRDVLAMLLGTTTLCVMTEVELPISEAARQAVEANDPELLKNIQLDPEVYADDSYRADLLIGDEDRRIAHLIEVKRATVNYQPARLVAYRKRLGAAAFMVPAILWKKKKIGVRQVEVLLLDAADADRRPGSCAIPFACLEDRLKVPGLTDAMAWARWVYAEAFQREAQQRLAELAGRQPKPRQGIVFRDSDRNDAGNKNLPPHDVPDWPIEISFGTEARQG